MNCRRVSKKKQKEPKSRALKLIKDIRNDLKERYVFDDIIVGSAHRNTIIEEDGKYDVDYQLRLTKNSPEYKTNNLSKPSDIKNDFFNSFNKFINSFERVENSTTAITVICYKESKKLNIKYSLDFVIVKSIPENNEIIRRNNSGSKNTYTWNQLSDNNEAYEKYRLMTSTQKNNFREYTLIPKLCDNKKLNENIRKTSLQIFIEEVTNYEL